MSLIKANAVQIGQSPTATQNFTLAVPSSPDGTIKLARGNSGATTQDVLSVDASGNVNSLVKSTGSTTARSLANRFADVVNVKDFGAVGDGVTDDTAAIQAAINFVLNNGKGKVFIPDGVYKISQELTIVPAPIGTSAGWADIVLEGGSLNTTLNFSTAASGQNGIKLVGWSGRIEICRILIQNAKKSGIFTDVTASTYLSRLNIHDVIIENSIEHGIHLKNTYASSFSDIECRKNGGSGFEIEGYVTATIFTRCWAGGDSQVQAGNAGHGWRINNINNSAFILCNSDNNFGNGYFIQNANQISFISCGAESNALDGFYLQTKDGPERTNSLVPDIRSIIFETCTGYDNCKNQTISPPTYSSSLANLFRIESNNNLSIQLSTKNCWSDSLNPLHIAMIINGNSGKITIEETLNFLNNGTRNQIGDVNPIYLTNETDGNLSGNFGIGKKPQSFGANWRSLFLYGSDGSIFRTESSNATVDLAASSGLGGYGVIGTTNNYPFMFQTNGTYRMRITNTGQVGISTSTPSSTLHVNGDLTMSSSTTAASATAGTSGATPAQVAGYLQVNINGTNRKIPFYAI